MISLTEPLPLPLKPPLYVHTLTSYPSLLSTFLIHFLIHFPADLKSLFPFLSHSLSF